MARSGGGGASERKLEIELRNGPALPSKLIDKVSGQWVEINPMNERLVRAEVGAKHDAKRDRKNQVVLGMIFDEAAEDPRFVHLPHVFGPSVPIAAGCRSGRWSSPDHFTA